MTADEWVAYLEETSPDTMAERRLQCALDGHFVVDGRCLVCGATDG